MFKLLPLVLKNCWRNRRRTVLTTLSVAASLSLLGVLLAIYQAFYLSDPTPEQALRLVTRHRVSLVFSMPESYGQKIRQVSGVREVMMQNWFGGFYKDRRPENLFARFAIEPDKLFTVRSEMNLPEEQKRDFQRERTACVIGKPLAVKYNLKVGDRITIQGDIFPVNLELTVRGIFTSPQNDEVLYFHRKYLEELQSQRLQGNTGLFVILADSPGAVPRISTAVDALFRNAPVQTKTEAEQAFQLAFINSLGNVKAFLLSICAAVTFTMLLVSGNTMAMSVRERVREVGVLKTLGFTRGMVLTLVLGEALLVSLAGGALGIALANALCVGARQAPAFLSQIKTLSVEPSLALVCLAGAGMMGLLSAAIPAWNASRLSILDALRGED